MRFEVARRLLAIVLSVALAAGTVLRPVPALATDAAVSGIPAVAETGMPVSAGDMAMPGKCSGCAGDEKAMAAGCFAFCGGAVASISIVIAYDPVCIATVEPSATPAATGHASPPDPYPPRPSILS